jgi:DDE superfamily endonuclease
MAPLPEAIILVLAPFTPLFSHRVWRHAQLLLLGAILAPGARTVTAALRVMGLAKERRFTSSHRGLHRASWSALQASRMLLGLLITVLVPPGATIVLGADDTVERRSGRKITAKGGYRDAVRSTKKHVMRCFGLKWVTMRLLVPVPWSRRVWALPLLTALCRPAEQSSRRRHKTGIDGVRQMMPQVRRWLPGRRLVLVVAGGFAAVSLTLACIKSRVVLVSRLRWDAALYRRPGRQPPGRRGPKPLKGKRQRSLQAWAERRDTPWETVAVDWYGGKRKPLWGFSRIALWSTPGLPPVESRDVLVADPAGKLRLEALFCTDLQAPSAQILHWVVGRWSVEVTLEETRAHLGLETQRQWSDQAIARTTPVLLALFSLVTVLALRLSHGGPVPVGATAWYHQAEPTFADCLALVRRHLWRARYVVNSAAEADCRQFPREALELLLNDLPLVA